MRRREFISLLGGAAAWPLLAHGQQQPARMPVVGMLNRPGGNATGVTFLAAQLLAKRLELGSQLVTKDAAIGFFGRPTEPRYAADRKELEAAAMALGRKLLFFDVAGERDFQGAFAAAA